MTIIEIIVLVVAIWTYSFPVAIGIWGAIYEWDCSRKRSLKMVLVAITWPVSILVILIWVLIEER